MITVFTPTYNRAYIIPNLYNSLLIQTYKDFEWLIVDDGSTDNTEELINGFINENKINIRFFKQKNGGKHRAINKGVKLANGELFFIVDSDDHLLEDSLYMVNEVYQGVMGDNKFAGLAGVRVFSNFKKIGGDVAFSVLDANALDIRMKHNVKGDLAEVFKTSILKKYLFPDFKGEKFCAEGLVWNRIAADGYKLRYTNKNIYVCEYLDDGLSNASVRNRIKSSTYATTIYKELYSYSIPLKHKIKAGINYWRFAFYRHESFFKMLDEIGYSSIVLLPLGWFYSLNDKRNI